MEPVAKSTLADAMNRRDPAVFGDLFNELRDRCTRLAPGHGFRFHNPLYVFDSTTIPLCLSVYDWAYYRKHKGAVKLHTQLDLSGNPPCYVVMGNGKMADIRAARPASGNTASAPASAQATASSTVFGTGQSGQAHSRHHRSNLLRAYPVCSGQTHSDLYCVGATS